MGVIQKQTIQNAVVNYFGIVLGYINVSVLFPKMLSMEEFGLTRLLLSLGIVYAQFSSFGILRAIVKFFPFFKTEDRQHRGVISFIFLIPLIGFLLITLLYLLGQSQIVKYYQEKSPLFTNYYVLGVIISFFMLYCNLLETYLSVILKTVIQNILRTVFLRVVWCIEVLLYHYQLISFEGFIWSFVLAYALNMALLLAYGFYLKQIQFKIQWHMYKPRLIKYIIHYSLYSILAGVTLTLVVNIDQFMLAKYIGLSAVSIYAVAMYVSSVMYIPYSSLGTIAFPVIARLWRERNLNEIKKIYQKSCVNLLLAGGLIFIIIWASIDEYISILPSKYAELKYVALFIAIGKLFDMATGLNTHIIAVSKFYRFETYSAIFLCICTILTNWWLIPIFQIYGAAIATAITLIIYNSLRIVYLYQKMNILPFQTSPLIRALIVILCPVMLTFILPAFGNIILSVLFKTSVVIILFFILLILLKPSEDLQIIIDKTQMRFLGRKII